MQLDHWRADIARIDAVARAMIMLEKGQYRDALRIACDIISRPACQNASFTQNTKFRFSYTSSRAGSLTKAESSNFGTRASVTLLPRRRCLSRHGRDVVKKYCLADVGNWLILLDPRERVPRVVGRV